MLTMDIQLWMDGGIVSVLCAISMSFTLFVPKTPSIPLFRGKSGEP